MHAPLKPPQPPAAPAIVPDRRPPLSPEGSPPQRQQITQNMTLGAVPNPELGFQMSFPGALYLEHCENALNGSCMLGDKASCFSPSSVPAPVLVVQACYFPRHWIEPPVVFSVFLPQGPVP